MRAYHCPSCSGLHYLVRVFQAYLRTLRLFSFKLGIALNLKLAFSIIAILLILITLIHGCVERGLLSSIVWSNFVLQWLSVFVWFGFWVFETGSQRVALVVMELTTYTRPAHRHLPGQTSHKCGDWRHVPAHLGFVSLFACGLLSAVC